MINSTEYSFWIAINEPDEIELHEQREIVKKLSHQPLFSLICPIYYSSVPDLKAMIDSVVVQTYTNWELVITIPDSIDLETAKKLNQFTSYDQRIKAAYLDKNLEDAARINNTIKLIKGELVGFILPDDQLAPFALFEIVSASIVDPEIDFFYSDEDTISEDGALRTEPFFKPDFNLEYLRGFNYISISFVLKRALGDQVSWLRDGYDDSLFYDLVLRLTETCKKIYHIPMVLYHQRSISYSAENNLNERNDKSNSELKALYQHFQRLDIEAEILPGKTPTTHSVHYAYQGEPLISILIPSRDHWSDLKRCIDSINQKSLYPRYEVILLENGSREPETFQYYELLKSRGQATVLEWKEPFNFSLINNWAAQKAKGEVLLFLNNDVEVITPNWLERMLGFALKTEIGAVGAMLYYPDGTIQHAGLVLGLWGVAGHLYKHLLPENAGDFNQLSVSRYCMGVTGACMMVRKDNFEEVGGFDPDYELAFGDVDFCMKLKAKGYQNLWTPEAELVHHESMTRGREDTAEAKARFRREERYFLEKWKKELEKGDPFYNPNLSITFGDNRLRMVSGAKILDWFRFIRPD